MNKLEGIVEGSEVLKHTELVTFWFCAVAPEDVKVRGRLIPGAEMR
jgi:hypothetical protein